MQSLHLEFKHLKKSDRLGEDEYFIIVILLVPFLQEIFQDLIVRVKPSSQKRQECLAPATSHKTLNWSPTCSMTERHRLERRHPLFLGCGQSMWLSGLIHNNRFVSVLSIPLPWSHWGLAAPIPNGSTTWVTAPYIATCQRLRTYSSIVFD